MTFCMIIILAQPNFALFLIVLVDIVTTKVTPVWIPWCMGIFVGAAAAKFFGQATAALLAASEATFVCMAIDKYSGVVVDAEKAPQIYADMKMVRGPRGNDRLRRRRGDRRGDAATTPRQRRDDAATTPRRRRDNATTAPRCRGSALGTAISTQAIAEAHPVLLTEGGDLETASVTPSATA